MYIYIYIYMIFPTEGFSEVAIDCFRQSPRFLELKVS